MKHLILSCLLLAVCRQAAAQRIHFGLRAGITTSRITAQQLKTQPGYRNQSTIEKRGFIGALFVEVPLFKYASVQTELVYNRAGYFFYWVDFASQINTYKLEYLSVPVLLKARFKGIGLYGGLQYSSLQSAYRFEQGYGRNSLTTDVLADHRKGEWAGIVGAEYTAPFGLGASVRFHLGMSNIARNGSYTYQTADEVRNRMTEVGFHYRFIRERKQPKHR